MKRKTTTVVPKGKIMYKNGSAEGKNVLRRFDQRREGQVRCLFFMFPFLEDIFICPQRRIGIRECQKKVLVNAMEWTSQTSKRGERR